MKVIADDFLLKIFGGEESRQRAFPFAALIGVTKEIKEKSLLFPQEETIVWVCGGTLINLWYVITGAQCQDDSGRGISHVKIGEWRVGEDLEIVQEFEIDRSDVVLHERYKKIKKIGQVDNDIAIIRLPRKVRVDSLVQIAFLPLSQSFAARELGVRNLGFGLIGQNVTIVGWGYTRYTKDFVGKYTLELETAPSRTQNYIEVSKSHFFFFT